MDGYFIKMDFVRVKIAILKKFNPMSNNPKQPVRSAEEVLKKHTGHAHGLMDKTTIDAMNEWAEIKLQEYRNQPVSDEKVEELAEKKFPYVTIEDDKQKEIWYNRNQDRNRSIFIEGYTTRRPVSNEQDKWVKY